MRFRWRRPVILVTGARGFVGRELLARLEQLGVPSRLALRRSDGQPGRVAVVGELGPDTDWREALEGCTAVVHLAARVHVMRETGSNSLAAFRSVNTAATEQLARQAAAAGVERFMFLSTVKVHGEFSGDEVFTERDPPAPRGGYALSKWEAECALSRVAAATGLAVTVLRPPLVYGRGAAGNFATLAAALRRGLPLPLASIRNRRSLVYVGNLVDAILACLNRPAAAGRTFLVSDGEDLSTPELLRRCARAMGTKARLWSCSVSLLRTAAVLTGQRAFLERLAGSLAVDASALTAALDWRAPFSVDEGMARALSTPAPGDL